jgi:hypothetical protein
MKKKRQFKSLRVLRESVRKDSRIFNFKRPKWKYLQRDLKSFCFPRRLFARRPVFKNQVILDSPRRIVRLSLSYKRFLLARLRFCKFYDLRVSLHSLKRLYVGSKSIYSFLMRFEYRLDVLLWRVGFFKNSSESRFYISRGYVKVNTVRVKSYTYVVKKGDLVQLDPVLVGIVGVGPTKRSSYINPFYAECSYNLLEVIILENPYEYLIPLSSYMYPRFLDLPGLRQYFNLN